MIINYFSFAVDRLSVRLWTIPNINATSLNERTLSIANSVADLLYVLPGAFYTKYRFLLDEFVLKNEECLLLLVCLCKLYKIKDAAIILKFCLIFSLNTCPDQM